MVHRLQKLATPIQSMAFGRDGLSVHPSLVGSLRYRSELSTKYGSSWECGSKDPLNDLVLETRGLCFGFAVDETPELIPLPISLRSSPSVAELRNQEENCLSATKC